MFNPETLTRPKWEILNSIDYTPILEIVGDTIRVRATQAACGGMKSLVKVVGLDQEVVNVQIFEGSKGISTDAEVGFFL